MNKHVNEIRPANSSCEKKDCEKRHPRQCKHFAEFRYCKIVRCAYSHNQVGESNENINELKIEFSELKQYVQRLSLAGPSENESRIKMLENEVKVLKMEIKNLARKNKKEFDKNQDIQNVLIQT